MIKNLFLMFVVLFVSSLSAVSAAEQKMQYKIVVKPSVGIEGELLNGVDLTNQNGDTPILVKVSGVDTPFTGKAHLQRGRAVIQIVEYIDVPVDGYVISPSDQKAGIPVKCFKNKESLIKPRTIDECTAGELRKGEQVTVIFPKGVDIRNWK
jgi:hypothetical protein